jgi:hypothetical protein
LKIVEFDGVLIEAVHWEATPLSQILLLPSV